MSTVTSNDPTLHKKVVTEINPSNSRHTLTKKKP